MVLISIDTLRADRLGSYGYPRPTSRHLDALAADGVRFDQAISQAPWTTPAHMSLMTSMYPSTHGVNLGWKDFMASVERRRRYRTLGRDVPTLAGVLRTHGYRTVAVTGGTTVSASLGFDRGFDRYRENFTNGFEHLNPSAEAAVFDMLAAYEEMAVLPVLPYLRGSRTVHSNGVGGHADRRAAGGAGFDRPNKAPKTRSVTTDGFSRKTIYCGPKLPPRSTMAAFDTRMRFSAVCSSSCGSRG